jgi:hypothetical protein
LLSVTQIVTLVPWYPGYSKPVWTVN